MRNDDITAATTDTMDTESFVDVHAEDALSVTVLPKHDVIGIDAKMMTTTQICVNMKARELPDEDKRAAVDIIVVLDISGSMTGKKLQLCKVTLEMLLRVLAPDDHFALITYSSNANIEIPARKMTASNKEAALKKIKSLHTIGSTNISAGIGLASQEMLAIEQPNEVRSIFLLTDGHANCGVCDANGLVELTRSYFGGDERLDQTGIESSSPQGSSGPFFLRGFGKAKSEEDVKPAFIQTKQTGPPISLHTFGYGTDHNAKLLREMASATQGGSYYFVEDDSNVGTAFGDALGGILSVVAQNAVVTLKVPQEAMNMGVEITKVYHEQSIKRDNGSYTVTVGDFYAEEARDVLFELKLAKPYSPTTEPIPHAMVSVAYADAIEKKLKQKDPICASIARPTGSEVSEANTHVSVQWVRVYATEEMKNAERHAENNDLGQARERIRMVNACIAAQCQDVQDSATLGTISEDMKLVEQGLESKAAYASHGSKYMSSTVRSHARQRASMSSAAAPRSAYQSNKKQAMNTRFTLT